MNKNRKVILFFVDIFLIISCLVAVSLIVDRSVPYLSQQLLMIIPLIAALYLCISVITGTYQVIWRYAENLDMIRLAISVTAAFASAMLLDFFFLSTQHLFIIYPFSAMTATLTLLCMRIVYAMMLKNRIKPKAINDTAVKKALVIGAGYTGKVILSELNTEKSQLFPVGLIDDDAAKVGRSMDGISVLGFTEDIPRICTEKQIDVLIFAIPSCDKLNKERILNICMSTDCELKIIPFISNIVESVELLSKMRDVKIDDLLGRDSITLENSDVAQYIRGKRCLITGGGGSIGSELCRQIAAYGPQFMLILDIYENNAYELEQELKSKFGSKLNLVVEIASVTDLPKMRQVFSQYGPDVVFHAAAHKHVPLMETNPEEAVKNNVGGTLNLITLAQEFKVSKFVLISSDKAVNPTNVMGATKRLCEMLLCAHSKNSPTEFASVRFGNVLGSNGSVIPLFKQQIAAGGPVTVTHPDIIRFFMTIPEAVSLVLHAATIARGGEIFILDMGKPVKIIDLAEKLIKLSGFEPYKDIRINFVGLRPGEKLYEELMLTGEETATTANNKIYVGEQNGFDYANFKGELDTLLTLASQNDKQAVIAQLKRMLPNFKHAKNIAKDGREGISPAAQTTDNLTVTEIPNAAGCKRAVQTKEGTENYI